MKMKRLVCIALNLAVLCQLFGCSSTSDATTTTVVTQTTTEATTTTEETTTQTTTEATTTTEETTTELDNRELMHQQYADVYNALIGNEWFFNGGADDTLNKISFEDDIATISQVKYGGNGPQDKGNKKYQYEIDDQSIIVSSEGTSELKIMYTLSGSKISFDGSEFYSPEEVDAAIQGCWKIRSSETILGMETEQENNIYFNKGRVKSESASKAYGGAKGEYYYYGPYEEEYTIGFKLFNTNSGMGKTEFVFNFWSFNIIDDQVTVLYCGKVCTRTDKLPGENGYKFK